MTDTPMETVAWLCRLPKLGCFVTDNIAVASECLTQQGVVAPLVTEAAASATIKGLEAEIERLQASHNENAKLRGQRDAALARAESAEIAENEAKDCFWSIYPRYLELGGAPVSTELARTVLVQRAEAAEAERDALREALRFYAKPENYKGEFVPNDYTEHGTYAMAHHVNAVRKDAGEIARAALNGEKS